MKKAMFKVTTTLSFITFYIQFFGMTRRIDAITELQLTLLQLAVVISMLMASILGLYWSESESKPKPRKVQKRLGTYKGF